MLRVGERVLLLALSEESDKHPLGYLSSRFLTHVEGRSSFVNMDCTLTSFRDAPPGERSWEPVVVSDCVFRVEACVDRHDAARASLSQHQLEAGPMVHTGMQPGTPVRYSKAVQLVHEFSGTLLCIAVQERAASEGFAMKVVLKTLEPQLDQLGGSGTSNEWSDSWWEVKSPGNVRMSQVLHYDEISLHSHRWHRGVRARRTPLNHDKKQKGRTGRMESPVDASFTHSLLRVVPYDDVPSLPASDGNPSVTTTTTILSSLSTPANVTTTSDLGRGVAPGAALNVSAISDGAVLRGGDVVRLCHSSSAGFLAHKTISMTRKGVDDIGWFGGGRGVGERKSTAKSEEKCHHDSSDIGSDSESSSGGSPFLYVSNTPHRRQKLQNASSNCLWVLERTHSALGGRPLRRSSNLPFKDRTASYKTSDIFLSSKFSAVNTSYIGNRQGKKNDTNANDNNKSDGSVGRGADVSSVPNGGHDFYAEAVAKRRRRQGAGDAVEYVRVKHLATMRYLCVGKKCDSKNREEKHRGEAAKRVGMLTVDPHAVVPGATVFVIRPRSAVGAGAPVIAAAADGGLGPEDLVHLQHRDTGLFLSALPRDEGSAGGRVGLTMVKSPLTTEYWRLTRTPDRERKATNHILAGLAQLKATLEPLLDEVQRLPLPPHPPAPFLLPPPIPPACVLRPAMLAVGNFHSVLSRGATLHGGKKSIVPDHRVAAGAGLDTDDKPGSSGRGCERLGERAGRGSTVWALARDVAESGVEKRNSKKRDKWFGLVPAAKSGGSFSSLTGAETGTAGRVGNFSPLTVHLDEFHANPRLRFQLLLREQGIIVTLFDAMESIFRAQEGILARTLWWDDSENNCFGGDSDETWGGGNVSKEIMRDRWEARHCLRQLTREAMALGYFFAKGNPRGKVALERYTPLLREMIGSGLGACELLVTIQRDNPRTSITFTSRRVQEVLSTLPKSRDLANSMRLMASICEVGRSVLPSMQRLVAATVLAGHGKAAASTNSANDNPAKSSGSSTAKQGKGGEQKRSRRGSTILFSRGLFRYELIREGDSGMVTSVPSSSSGKRLTWASSDGTRGIRVRLKRLVEGPSVGKQKRRSRETGGETNVISGKGVVFEAVQEGFGLGARIVVRVLSRGGVEDPSAGQGGGGASSGARDLLQFFVASVRLLSSLCRERHTENINLIRSLKGTSYEGLMEVVRCATVPLPVRSAFAELVQSCHLDVAPLLPQPPIRYVRLKDDEENEESDTFTSDRDSEEEKRANCFFKGTPATSPRESKIAEEVLQRKRLRDALEFAEDFLEKHTRPGGTLHFDRWASGEGTTDQKWEWLYVKEPAGKNASSAYSFPDPSYDPSKATTKVTQQPLQPGQSKPSPSPSTAFGPATPEPKIVVTSIISKPLQLTECLRLFGAVLSLLRLTLVLLGRRPLGRRLKDGNPAPRLFRRLCSLLEFLEGAREMRSSFLRRETGGGGGMATGRGGGLFGRSSHVSAPLGDTSVGAIVGSECDFAPTSKLMDSLASDNTVGITDIELSVMRVLTLLIQHQLDGQIDEVLRLAEMYDEDENAFRFWQRPGEPMVATFDGDNIWEVVHCSGVGLLAGKAGETTVHNLSKTLLKLAVAGQERVRVAGPTLTARSLALLFRISDQGNQLVKEARKVTLLSGQAAARTHYRLAHAVVALRAFSRRRSGRSTKHYPQKCSVPPSPRLQPSGGTVTVNDAVVKLRHAGYSFPSQSPLLASSPLSESLSSNGSGLDASSASGTEGGDDGGVGEDVEARSSPAMEAWASAAAAAEVAAAAATAVSAAARAAAASAAAQASLAAEEAAEAEEDTIEEALQEVRAALASGQNGADGIGAEVERVAAGVGLAPALLGALRALRREYGNRPGAVGGGRAGALAEDVMDLLRLLVKAGPNAELRGLVFSNFSVLLSFLREDTYLLSHTFSSDGSRQSADLKGGGHRLHFASPVARLMVVVINGDALLATSISDEHLSQLAKCVARSRESELLTLLQKFVACQGTPIALMQRRVMVALLRELSRVDFHVSFGWENFPSLPAEIRLQRADSHPSSSSNVDGLLSSPTSIQFSPAYARIGTMVPSSPLILESWRKQDSDMQLTSPYVNAPAASHRRQEVSWGVGHPRISAAEGGGEGGSVYENYGGSPESGRDSATSGLGFMTALQRTLVQQQGKGEDGKGEEDDHHALELLCTIAACCEGKNHFTEVQCRSMVSFEDLVALITRGMPSSLRGTPASFQGNTAGASKRDVKKEASHSPKNSFPMAGIRVSPSSAAISKKAPDLKTAMGVHTSAEHLRTIRLLPEQKELEERVENLPSNRKGLGGAPRSEGGGGSGGNIERPLPASVRWALMWLLDSLFFTVKEPVEGLDRHPAVHALLESFHATTQFCTKVPADKRWENDEVDFIMSTAAPCLHNFFEGCWKDPLPFVAKTARELVSKLAVLFYTLAEDVRQLAENAGLTWRWREVDGVKVDKGAWEGTCDEEMQSRLKRRKLKLRHLRDFVFDLYLSSDCRKRDLFSLFRDEQLKAQANGSFAGIGGDYSDTGRTRSSTMGSDEFTGRARDTGRIRSSTIGDEEGTELAQRGSVGEYSDIGRSRGSTIGDDEHFSDVFRVMQELDMIAEESPTESLPTPAPAARVGSRLGSLTKGSRVETKMGTDKSVGREAPKGWPRNVLWNAGGNSSSVRGRGVGRSGSVRFSRRRSSGGSSGFYRDAGQVGDDNWQSITAALPDIAPRLPLQWTSGKAELSDSPQPSTPTSPIPRASPQKSISGVGGCLSGSIRNKSLGSSKEGLGSSVRRGLHSSLSGGGVGFGSGGSFRTSRLQSGSSREGLGKSSPGDEFGAEGSAATAAASNALLYAMGGSLRGGDWSNRSSFSAFREDSASWSSSGNCPDRGKSTKLLRVASKGGISSRSSLSANEGGKLNVRRLQLGEHKVFPLLEASVAENGELEALIAEFRKTSRDDYVRALISYVCSPAIHSEYDVSVLDSSLGEGADPSNIKSSADSDPDVVLKRFGLQILRAVIVNAPPVGDGTGGLPGVWQAGGATGSGVSREAKRGRKLDEKAIRLDREKTGRKQQQERIARLGGGNTILLFVGGLSSSSTRDTAADAFTLAVEMLQGGNKQVQEHFFAVLRDSREDEHFFAVITNFVRTSVVRLADACRRRILRRRRGAAEHRVRIMAATGSVRSAVAKRRRRRRLLRRNKSSGGSSGLRSGWLKPDGKSSWSDSESELILDLSRGIQRGGRADDSRPRSRASVRGVAASKAAAAGVPKRSEAIPTMAEMPITAAELNSGNRGEPVSEDEEQGDDDESPAAFPAAPSTAEDGEKDVSSLSALMEFLRLLCENHYLEMQDYMRTQPDNLRSYNMVTEVSGLLQGLEWVMLDGTRHWGIDSKTVDLASTVVRTLVEFAQGNEGNKLTIATPMLSSTINDLLAETFDGRGHDESIDAAHKRGECKVSPSRLKHQVFVLLYSLIEGCHEPSVFSILLQTLDFEVILGVVQETREVHLEASRDYRAKELAYFNIRRSKWRTLSQEAFSKSWKLALAKATKEFKSSEDKWRSARRGYSTPIVFLRALLDGAKVEHPKLCAKEENRFKFFLKEWVEQIRCIEIRRGGRLENMYFVVPDWCRVHWGKTPVVEMREDMKKRCAQARSSPGWKLLKFYQHGEGMLSQMAYLHTLQATSLHIITVHEVMWSYFAFVLALAVNVFDTLVPGEGSENSWSYNVGATIGVAHVLVSSLRLVAFMYNRQQKWLMEQKLPELALLRRVLRLGPRGVGDDFGPPEARPSSNRLGFVSITSSGRLGSYSGKFCLPRKIRRIGVSEVGASAAGNIHGGNDKRRHGGAINTSSFGEFDWHSGTSSDNSSYSSDSDEEEQHSIRGKARGERDRDVGGRGKEVRRVDRLTRVAVMLHSSKWNVLYMFVSVLGLLLSLASDFKSRSACYAFCLLDVSVRYRAMHRVLRAVSRNWAMLWQTAMLVVIVLFIFAAVGTAAFEQDFAVGQAVEAVSDNAEDFGGCSNLGECSITLFQYALRGDLGTYLFLMSDQDDSWHRLRRFLFDVSYWVLVPLLLLNMVSGVILDSFAQLRDEETGLKKELKSRCVVCGISRNDFDRGGNVFFEHTMNEHNMWNYVLVRAYLNDKPELEHTGQESYVHGLQRGNPDGVPDVSYFPIGKAKVLENRGRKNDDE